MADWTTKIPSRFVLESNLTIKNTDYTIGLERTASGSGSGTWKYINSSGELVDISSTYFSYHPVYSGMTQKVIDNQTMVYVPKFYVKTSFSLLKNSSNEYEIDTYRIWISYVKPADNDDSEETAAEVKNNIINLKKAGFKLHPAFYSNGEEIPGNGIYIGAYKASLDSGGTVACSVGSEFDSNNEISVGKKPVVGYTFNFWKEACANRNTDATNSTNWHMMTIYEYSALQTLFLIQNGTTNSQIMCGTGNVNAIGSTYSDCLCPVDDTNSTYNPVWNGFNSLWGNASEFVDGIRIDENNKISIWKYTGNTEQTGSNSTEQEKETYINTNKVVASYLYDEDKKSWKAGTNCGYYSDILAELTDDYSLTDVFLPNCSTLTSESSDGTFSDYMFGTIPAELDNNGKYVYRRCAVGGDYESSSAKAGIFYIRMDLNEKLPKSDETKSSLYYKVTTRLAKY